MHRQKVLSLDMVQWMIDWFMSMHKILQSLAVHLAKCMPRRYVKYWTWHLKWVHLWSVSMIQAVQEFKKVSMRFQAMDRFSIEIPLHPALFHKYPLLWDPVQGAQFTHLH